MSTEETLRPTAPLWEAIWTAKIALSGAPRTCQWHGTEFAKAGFTRGEPRCDSCKQPFRVNRALNTIMALEGLA